MRAPGYTAERGRADFKYAVHDRDADILLAAEGDLVVGLASVYADILSIRYGPRGWLQDLVVTASHRGRGIGLDVVRRSIRRLKGSIVVRSVEGKGTTFTVTVPITLALVQALIVRAGGQRFAIPIASIRENVRLEEHRRRRLETGEVYDHPLGTLPLLRLDRLIGAPPTSPGAGCDAKYWSRLSTISLTAR